jgi:hypothetical protein
MKKFLIIIVFAVGVMCSFSACSPYYYDSAYARPRPTTRYYGRPSTPYYAAPPSYYPRRNYRSHGHYRRY